MVQKLRDQEVEKIGRTLGDLRAQRSEVEQLSETIHQQTLDALGQPAEGYLPFTAQFVSEAARLQKSLAREVARLKEEETGQESALVDAFIDAKSNETVLEATVSLAASEEMRQEADEMNERAAFAHFQRVRSRLAP